MAYVSIQTINNDLIDSLNEYIRAGVYIEESSIDAKRFFRDADKLMGADPHAANLVKAGIFQICGNLERTLYHLHLASKLPTETKAVSICNSAAALSNIGAYSEGQKYFNLIDSPDSVPFETLIESGYGCFSVLKMNDLFEIAKRMKLEIDGNIVNLNSRMKGILSKNNINDAILAEYADVFGSVLRENRIMIKSPYPEFIVGDKDSNWSPDTLFITYRIDSDAKSAAALYKEATRRLIEKFSAIPETLHFSIEAF